MDDLTGTPALSAADAKGTLRWYEPEKLGYQPPGDVEAEPMWYERRFGNRRFGIRRRYLDQGAGALYGILVLVFCLFVADSLKENWVNGIDLTLSNLGRVFLILWISIGPPTWFWFESRSFESWVRELPKWRREIERAYFKLMLDHAKAFWAAFLAIASVVVVRLS